MHSSHEFRSLKAKIRVLCKQRRIRLEEFMKTFDIHHVKKIKVEQFKRALDVSGLQLTSEEMNLIVAKYRLKDEPLFVDYRRFCDLIDKAFTVKGLEGKPDLCLSIHNELPAQKKFAIVPLSDMEEQVLTQAKAKLATAVRNKGIVLKDVFHGFDRSNAGKVTKSQFVRDLLDIVVLSSAEVEALVKAYGNELDVNYRVLHYDIAPNSGNISPGRNSPDRPRRFTAPASMSSELDAVQELEASLSELTMRDRIRTKNFFTDFDPLRTGKCTEAQFKRCVKLCYSSVTEAELDLLVKKYLIRDLVANKVDYIRFCNHVEGKSNRFSSQDINSDDTLASFAGLTPAADLKCSREVRGNLSDAEVATFQAMMQRLSSYCSQRRLLLKPAFQDFDRGRREHITVDQFFRVMTMLKLTIASEAERKALLKHFSSSHGDRFVNYVTFCYDIDHWEENNNRPSSSGGRSSGIASEILSPTRIQSDTFETTAASTQVRSVPMLMRYIKQTVKRDRIRLEEYYRDFDKLRHGKITAAQFAAGLGAGGLLLTKEEVGLLGEDYALEDVDSIGNHLVAWKKFVEDVESVFTVKGLERMPNHDLTDLQTKGEQFGGAKQDKDLTSMEEHKVTQAIVTMKKAIDRQRLEFKAAFEDFDRSKQGFISATKFDRVLSMFQLLPEAVTARLIVIKFREQTSMGNSMTLSSICDVNYRAFLNALDLVGKVLANGDDTTSLILPGSVAYRQGVYASGLMQHDGMRRQTRGDKAGVADVHQVVRELRRQLDAKRIRMKEFIAEGDKLRSGEVTVAKFHTALNRSGCVLDAVDVNTVTEHFRSAKNSDKIDWRAFLEALDRSNDAYEGCSPEQVEVSSVDVPNTKVSGILTKLRSEVNSRRLHMKPYFQDYDHNRVCRVTKFQFAAVLDMMKLNLTPQEIALLQQQFVVHATGRKTTTDVNYVTFIQAVDSEYS
ncbi:hypothetical protein Poli38472_007640 [Pythium oligandrum]|uniref:EF-hand domain-containing protein n=1 Tax=Pythium oligandrum TaxID=41045 RepID=A0A8K1CS62_PYTOL|nr:hypothetical protein Poli38472_007640 [Pythium oligandrum]|eukprot:TMW67968.1 hypothetical protein Poli38472_007640 [Pythium oligandrum]